VLSNSFSDGLVLQGRRDTHVAILRVGLALGYLFIEGAAALAGEVALSALVGTVFAFYSLALLVYRRNPSVRSSLPLILAADLVRWLLARL
jgi:hypothetical protein